MVAVLLDIGLQAAGGVEAVNTALKHALKYGHPRILNMLLGIGGEEMRV